MPTTCFSNLTIFRGWHLSLHAKQVYQSHCVKCPISFKLLPNLRLISEWHLIRNDRGTVKMSLGTQSFHCDHDNVKDYCCLLVTKVLMNSKQTFSPTRIKDGCNRTRRKVTFSTTGTFLGAQCLFPGTHQVPSYQQKAKKF